MSNPSTLHPETTLSGPASKPARLTVVGAGVGDPELITLKAIKARGQAD